MPSTAHSMRTAPAQTLTDEELDIVERTAFTLDDRRLTSSFEIKEFIRNVNVTGLCRRRGVSTANVPRKAFRRIRKEVLQKLVGRLPQASVTRNQAYLLVLLVINRHIHKGRLPLKPGAKISFCNLNTLCVLGCPHTVEGGEIFKEVEFGVDLDPQWTAWDAATNG